MKNKIFSKLLKKPPLLAMGILILLVSSILFLWVGSIHSKQAVPSLFADVAFQGEYKIGDGDWQPIREGQHIPSTKGDITLCGFFQMHNPTTKEPIKQLTAGTPVSLYFNHIGGKVLLPNDQVLLFDAEAEHLGEDACAVFWSEFTLASDEKITIILHNPHRFGNETAVDDFLENMSLASGAYLASDMQQYGDIERNIGLFIVIASLILLGIATFSTVIHIKGCQEMWLIGLMSLFAGGYFMFDSFAVSLWSSPYIINTRALGLCMMFYLLLMSTLITRLLNGKYHRVAMIASILSAVFILCAILLSFLKLIKFYDMWLYWAMFESLIVFVLIVCQLFSLKGTPLVQKLLYLFGIIALATFPLDVLATALGWWEGGLASKHVFLAVFVMALVIMLRIIPSHINTALKAKQLEAEQQRLKLELQESRISIMLSQMQPHFIFNTLNTIYHLCEINPETAKTTISFFSEYLRNNIDNLGQSEMIMFEKEMSFVKTYLEIEKIRFDDELNISFDIAVTNFKLPVLTVQPIVENAVKHGTSKKEGGADLLLATAETDTHYRIIIKDTGVGFDPTSYENDKHKHIGINNVRQRLANLCNGTLTIDSTPGIGTTAVIEIPKKELNEP